jgi:MvaI/BcnI restriction endonuclease family
MQKITTYPALTTLQAWTKPPSRKELREHIAIVLDDGRAGSCHQVPSGKGWGGDGVFGKYLESFVSVRAGNRDNADACGIEIKTHQDGGTPVTLFHLDPEKAFDGRRYTAVAALSPLLKYHGKINENPRSKHYGHLGLYDSVVNGISDAFQLTKANGILTMESCFGHEIHWKTRALGAAAITKLSKVAYVTCETFVHTDGTRFVRYLDVQYLSDICEGADFTDAIVQGMVTVGFDCLEKKMGSFAAHTTGKYPTMRNRGVKFRINMEDRSQLWGSGVRAAG